VPPKKKKIQFYGRGGGKCESGIVADTNVIKTSPEQYSYKNKILVDLTNVQEIRALKQM
jgi:hypothetical protein